jgi:hypothetical protein
MAANAFAPRAGTLGGHGFEGHGFRGGEFHHGFRGRGFALGAFGPYGYDDYYDYPDYAYGDSYYDNGSCYVVHRRVHTKAGWRLEPVQVCS